MSENEQRVMTAPGTAPADGQARTPGQAAYEDLRRELDEARGAVAQASRECAAAARLVTEAGAQRDQARAELAGLRAHAVSLETDLDDAGATIEDYRNEVSRLSHALRRVCEETGTSTMAHHIARDALADLDQPQRLPDLRRDNEKGDAPDLITNLRSELDQARARTGPRHR